MYIYQIYLVVNEPQIFRPNYSVCDVKEDRIRISERLCRSVFRVPRSPFSSIPPFRPGRRVVGRALWSEVPTALHSNVISIVNPLSGLLPPCFRLVSLLRPFETRALSCPLPGRDTVQSQHERRCETSCDKTVILMKLVIKFNPFIINAIAGNFFV